MCRSSCVQGGVCMHAVRLLFVLGLPVLTLLFPLSFPSARAQGGVTVTITDEVSGNNHTGRSNAAALNDQWFTTIQNAGYTCIYQLTSILADGYFTNNGNPANNPIDGSIGPIATTISNRDMTNLSDPNHLGDLGGDVLIGTSLGKSLQDTAPMPDPDPGGDGGTRGWYRVNNGTNWEYWNENSGSATSRNAVLFEFQTPVSAFGLFVGDLETRTDGGGTPALLRYKVTGDTVYTVTIPTSTTDQSICDTGAAGCGNKTTRWIGLHAASGTTFDWVLLIVGDNGPGDGLREHLSWVGATVAFAPGSGGCAAGSGGPTAIQLTAFAAAPSTQRTPFAPAIATLLGGMTLALWGLRKWPSRR